MFPKHTKPTVAKFLFDEASFSTRKTEWKRPQKEGETDKHHLPNLAYVEKYDGLFGLIAAAGLSKLKLEEKTESRGRKRL